jgi:hypothetical protein
MVRLESTKTRAGVLALPEEAACLRPRDINERPPTSAVAEHANPALEACLRKRRLEAENWFMESLNR